MPEIGKRGKVQERNTKYIQGNLFPEERPKPSSKLTTTSSLAQKIAHNKELSQNNDDSPHLIVTALAGTGKTTTLVEGMKIVKGLKPSLEPSPEQEAIWEAMALSKGKARTITFCAFNSSIAVELKKRVPLGTEARTIHSLGNEAVTNGIGRLKLDEWKVHNIVEELLPGLRYRKPMLYSALEELTSLCKMNLIGLNKEEDTSKEICDLVEHHQIFMDDQSDFETASEYVPKILKICSKPQKDRTMNFDDMIWLPLVNNLVLKRSDLLCIDESQDLNHCQQELVFKMGKRIIVVGDENQAVYGFAGADSESISNMNTHLTNQSQGCKILPLTVTRRCSHTIVKEANKYVPDFKAYPTNPQGSIGNLDYLDYHKQVKEEGDMILCRVNAPLVSQCLRFISQGKKSFIEGRQIGSGLVSTIKSLKPETIEQLRYLILGWADKHIAKEGKKKHPNPLRIQAIVDRMECIKIFALKAKSVDECLREIDGVFKKSHRGIRCSSIHRAKGLEAQRVFWLLPKGAEVPHPSAETDWQIKQEYNLSYVAITRGIESLYYVQ